MSPVPAADAEQSPLDPFRLLLKIHTLETSQRELTVTLTHTTERFSDLVQGLRQEISRLVEVSERQVDQHAHAQKSRDREIKVIGDRVNTFRGALLGFGLVGGLLITLATAYVQSQMNAIAARVDRCEMTIRELQQK